MPEGRTSLDDLIAESRRIQDALIRVVVKLDVFAELLVDEAARLKEATDGRIPEGGAAPDDASGGTPGAEGSGTSGDGGSGGQ